MSLIWDAKNNFILAHSIAQHEQRSTMATINWSSVVNDIRLEISSTPVLLKSQYEHLRETFQPEPLSTSLYTATKRTYLHSLCEKIESDLQVTLATVYELIRQARSERINLQDIEQLLKEWNFESSSDEERENKQRLFNMLNRLRHYIQAIPDHNRCSTLSEQAGAVDSSTAQAISQDEDLELISDSEGEEPPVVHKPNELTNNNRLVSDVTAKEKPLLTRRRTRSLTLSAENKDNQVNIGVEWFVPKLKRQQRSSSLHAQIPLIPEVESPSLQNQQLQSSGILLTTVDNDESSNSNDNSNVRRTRTEPSISWLPLTNQQIEEKQSPPTEPKPVDDQQLDQVSSTDSESVEIQWSSSSPPHKTSGSPASNDVDEGQRENSAAKRQRLS